MITEKPNILIVDDRPDGLLALEAVLDFPDCRLIPASGGHEALAIANSYPLALILLDVQMPEMDGFECARRVKDIPHAKDVPIIFITAISKDMTNVYRGYESGAVDYLLKPFDPQVLRAKVAVFLDLFRKNQQLEFQSRQLLEAEQKAQSQKMAEIEIENLRRYRRLADAIPHIVMRVEPNGTGDYFNGTWKSFTGLTIDKSHGTGWHSAFDSVDLAAMLTAWSGAARNQDTFEYEVRIARADGMMRWHLVRGVSEDPSDPTGRWIFTCTDIHDRKESEEALNAQALDLARSNSDLQQFAYSASHDLQEPLRKITIFADLLRQTQGTNGDTSKWQSYLGKIQESATSMSDLVQGLLAYSRIHGKEEVLEAVDLNDIVASVLSNLEVSINAASASVRLNRMPVVKANRIWMQQLFQNLLSNALKFRGERTPEILVRAEHLGAEWQISVSDNGIGIEPAYQTAIFKMFQRLHTKSQYPGAGIGLAIAKRIVERQGGRMWVESAAGKGSTFYFTLPALPVGPVAVGRPALQSSQPAVN